MANEGSQARLAVAAALGKHEPHRCSVSSPPGQMFHRFSFDFLKRAEFSTICTAAAAAASTSAAARYLSW